MKNLDMKNLVSKKVVDYTVDGEEPTLTICKESISVLKDKQGFVDIISRDGTILFSLTPYDRAEVVDVLRVNDEVAVAYVTLQEEDLFTNLYLFIGINEKKPLLFGALSMYDLFAGISKGKRFEVDDFEVITSGPRLEVNKIKFDDSTMFLFKPANYNGEYHRFDVEDFELTDELASTLKAFLEV